MNIPPNSSRDNVNLPYWHRGTCSYFIWEIYNKLRHPADISAAECRRLALNLVEEGEHCLRSEQYADARRAFYAVLAYAHGQQDLHEKVFNLLLDVAHQALAAGAYKVTYQCLSDVLKYAPDIERRKTAQNQLMDLLQPVVNEKSSDPDIRANLHWLETRILMQLFTAAGVTKTKRQELLFTLLNQFAPDVWPDALMHTYLQFLNREKDEAFRKIALDRIWQHIEAMLGNSNSRYVFGAGYMGCRLLRYSRHNLPELQSRAKITLEMAAQLSARPDDAYRACSLLLCLMQKARTYKPVYEAACAQLLALLPEHGSILHAYSQLQVQTVVGRRTHAGVFVIDFLLTEFERKLGDRKAHELQHYSYGLAKFIKPKHKLYALCRLC